MAIHLDVNNNQYRLNHTSGFTHASPSDIHELMGNITESELIRMTSLIKPDILNDILTQKQYWIRYLMCCGRYNDAINEINNVSLNNVESLNVETLLNTCHNDFNGNTLLHHAVRWCPNMRLLQAIIYNGGQIDIEDNDGNYPEEGIINSVWFNPFSRIINSPIVFHHHQTNNDGFIEREVWYTRDEDDFINAIRFIQIQAGEDNDFIIDTPQNLHGVGVVNIPPYVFVE